MLLINIPFIYLIYCFWLSLIFLLHEQILYLYINFTHRGRGITVFTPHMKRRTEGTPHLQKHIIESMESCGMKPQNAAPTQPQREIRQDSRSKRKRCAICPAAKDRKASSSCSQCTRPVCKEHRHEVVICDSCKHLDGHLLYTHDLMWFFYHQFIFSFIRSYSTQFSFTLQLCSVLVLYVIFTNCIMCDKVTKMF